MKSSEKISKEEIVDSLKRSGYLLEGRIEKALKRAGYYVQTNSVYPDTLTNKLRELDIQAITANEVSSQMEYFFSVLFIECVNNPQPFVFFTKESPIHFLNHHHLKMAGMPLGFFDKKTNSWKCLHDELEMQKFLHYCKPKQATQFCSFSQKKDNKQWQALHENEHFDSFKKLVDFLDFDADQFFKNYTWAKNEKLNVQAYYPVLVVQGDLFEAKEKNSGVNLIPSNHVQFCMPRIIRGKEVDVFIDVVNEKYFQKYLDIVRKEALKITKRLIKKRKEIKSSLEKIVVKIKNRKNYRELISLENLGCSEKF